MEGPVGSALSRGNVGTPLFDRIGALAHKIASGGGATPRFSQSDIGIRAKAQEVFFPGAGTAISEQPGLCAVRTYAQGETLAILEEVGLRSRFGVAKRQFRLRFDVFGAWRCPRNWYT